MGGKSAEVPITPPKATQEKLPKRANFKKRITRVTAAAMVGISSLIGGRDTLPSPSIAQQPHESSGPTETIPTPKPKSLEVVYTQMQ